MMILKILLFAFIGMWVITGIGLAIGAMIENKKAVIKSPIFWFFSIMILLYIIASLFD